jgi:hypothetical protein
MADRSTTHWCSLWRARGRAKDATARSIAPAITYADRAHRHLGGIGWISAAFFVSGSIYLSSQTSSMRQLLKMLLTIIVRPLT